MLLFGLLEWRALQMVRNFVHAGVPGMESLLICVCAARILGSAEVDMPDAGSVDTLRFC